MPHSIAHKDLAGGVPIVPDQRDFEIATLRAEVASKNEQFQQYARKMESDMNALAAENERLRAALDKMQRSRDRYRQAWEAEKVRARAALASVQPSADAEKESKG